MFGAVLTDCSYTTNLNELMTNQLLYSMKLLCGQPVSSVLNLFHGEIVITEPVLGQNLSLIW